MQPDLLGDNESRYDTSLFPPPREFQHTAHEKLREGARQKHRYQMLCSPTGSGKTYLGMRACSESLGKGKRAMFLADRLTLIDQASTTADRYGLGAHGIIQGNHWRTDRDFPFQIASAQTLDSRGWGKVDQLDLLIIDEAHTQRRGWLDYLKTYEGHVIGLSATPFSAGLGKVFSNLVNAATMAQLIDEGVLCPLRVLTCIRPNMKGAETAAGEWTQEAAAKRGMAIVGDIVSEWQAHADGRKTICFGATIAHCEAIARQFNEAGIMAAVFCADTTPSQRLDILAEYRKAESVLRVLVSVEALAKGFDVPDVGCIIDARPLRKGFSTFVQILGRGMRSSTETGKTDCLLLDHSGNVVRFAEDFEHFYFNGIDSLDAGERLDKEIRKDVDEREVRSCPKCGFSPFMSLCLSCGFKRQRTSRVVHEASAGMREILIGKVRYNDRRQDLHDQLVSLCIQIGTANPQGRSAHLYREKVGTWPAWSFEAAADKMVPVSDEVRRYEQHNRIRFAKSRK